MKRKLKNYSVKEFCDALAKKIPAPGGGSAAALSAALGVSLLAMVSEYSIKKSTPAKIKTKLKLIIKQSNGLKEKLIDCVDRDAEAYLALINSKDKTEKIKKKALKDANQVPLDVCLLCYKAIDLGSYLVTHGSKYLISDVEVASEMLLAAYNSSMATIQSNS